MTEADRCVVLRTRLRQLKSRLAARRWEYRQRDCAKGAWPKLCCALARAEYAFEISQQELDELIAEGHELHCAGSDLHPVKRIVFVSARRAEALRSRRSIPLHLTPPLLVAERLALVPFDAQCR